MSQSNFTFTLTPQIQNDILTCFGRWKSTFNNANIPNHPFTHPSVKSGQGLKLSDGTILQSIVIPNSQVLETDKTVSFNEVPSESIGAVFLRKIKPILVDDIFESEVGKVKMSSAPIGTMRSELTIESDITNTTFKSDHDEPPILTIYSPGEPKIQYTEAIHVGSWTGSITTPNDNDSKEPTVIPVEIEGYVSFYKVGTPMEAYVNNPVQKTLETDKSTLTDSMTDKKARMALYKQAGLDLVPRLYTELGWIEKQSTPSSGLS